MTLSIDLTPFEEARISAVAERTGLAQSEFVKKMLDEHLPVFPTTGEEELDAMLRKWQSEDGTALMPDVPTQALFAQWAKEDVNMTDEEREAEDRLWEDLEKAFGANDGQLRPRKLG